MADDFYVHSARVRMDRIEAEKSRALADLADAKANSDYETAAYTVQTIANLNSEAQNLTTLHSQYIASQNPPAPPEVQARRLVGSEMFERDPRDLTATLSEMERQSRVRMNFEGPAALEKMKSYLVTDRRFDGYDADPLVRRVQECRQSGAVLDLDDPRLRGLPPRPLDRRTG